MKITNLFSSHMVIQRDKVQHIWGTTTPLTPISGTFGYKSFTGTSDAEGSFNIELPQLPYGGPYLLTITGDTTVTYTDVLVGDVYICGGQSNMEYTMGMLIDRRGYKEVVEHEGFVRSFEVPKVFKFDSKTDELNIGQWCRAENDDIRSFSAVGFYAAKEIYRETKVPVGLIHCAVGGTPAKSWCSEETIRAMGLYTKELELTLTPDYVKNTEAKDNDFEKLYMDTAWKSFEGNTCESFGTVDVPSIWRNNELKDFSGTVSLEKEITLSREQAEKSLDLYLGTIRDVDKTYVNDVFVGTSFCRYPTRRYHIGSNILHEGKNIIRIDLIVNNKTGGIDDGKKVCLCEAGTCNEVVDLSGKWTYKIKRVLPPYNGRTFFMYYPAGFYNGMLYALRNYKVRGALFYQGESNVEFYKSYEAEMNALISDWRKLFADEDMLFVEVQLAGYCDNRKTDIGDGWAYLREEQLKVSRGNNVVLVEAYDLGEYNDLHPYNKEALGRRMGMQLCRNLKNPEVKEAKVLGKDVVVTFKYNNDDSTIPELVEEKKVYNLKIVDDNGICNETEGEVKDNKLYIKDADCEEILYAWSDCAFNINLYDKNGIPVVPFRVKVEK